MESEFEVGEIVNVDYVNTRGSDASVQGEVVETFNRGNHGSDFTMVVIEDDDRHVYASRGYKYVRSIPNWDGTTANLCVSGQKIGEFTRMKSLATGEYDSILDFIHDADEGEQVELRYWPSSGSNVQTVRGTVEDAGLREWTKVVTDTGETYTVYNGGHFSDVDDYTVKRDGRKIGTFRNVEVVA